MSSKKEEVIKVQPKERKTTSGLIRDVIFPKKRTV